jgi:hypothetical protein
MLSQRVLSWWREEWGTKDPRREENALVPELRLHLNPNRLIQRRWLYLEAYLLELLHHSTPRHPPQRSSRTSLVLRVLASDVAEAFARFQLFDRLLRLAELLAEDVTCDEETRRSVRSQGE